MLKISRALLWLSGLLSDLVEWRGGEDWKRLRARRRRNAEQHEHVHHNHR